MGAAWDWQVIQPSQPCRFCRRGALDELATDEYKHVYDAFSQA